MKEQAIDSLKKFWFVILVGCIFIGFAIYFAYDTNKDKIPGKSVDGKDVIFSAADVDYTADEYYQSLFNTDSDGTKSGVSLLYVLLEKSVAEQLDSTDKMEESVEETTKSMEEYYQSVYADNYESYMNTQMKAMGYDGVEDLEQFLLDQAKLDKIVASYIKKHPDLIKEVFESESPRVISHILIKCEDPDNPTAEETAKMEKVKKALDKGTAFTKVAKKYSDDSSKTSGGSLGLKLKSDSLVDEFKTAAWNLKAGEMSDWVKSEYGYHLILIDETKQDKIMKNETYASTINSKILTNNANMKKQIVWNKAKKLGIKINDKDLKKELMTYIGVEK